MITSDTTVEPRTFYSQAGNLIISINKGRRVTDENGVSKMVEQKVAEFTPQGDGFGKLITNDAEIIEKLTTRCGILGDVFEAAEYARRTTPAEILLQGAQAENKRLLDDHNRLLALLKEKGIKVEEPVSKK